MSFAERLSEAGTSIVLALIGAVGSAVIWFIRRVLTNQKQIELLSQEIAHRDKLRDVDRADITEVKNSVKRIEGWIIEGRK